MAAHGGGQLASPVVSPASPTEQETPNVAKFGNAEEEEVNLED